MSTKEKLLDDLTEVEEIHPNYVSAVITGGAYFNEPPKIDLKNDHPHLIIYTYKEGDGCWGIAVQAHWGYFGRYPIAFIRTKSSQNDEYGFGDEYHLIQEIVKHYNESTSIRDILAEYM